MAPLPDAAKAPRIGGDDTVRVKKLQASERANGRACDGWEYLSILDPATRDQTNSVKSHPTRCEVVRWTGQTSHISRGLFASMLADHCLLWGEKRRVFSSSQCSTVLYVCHISVASSGDGIDLPVGDEKMGTTQPKGDNRPFPRRGDEPNEDNACIVRT